MNLILNPPEKYEYNSYEDINPHSVDSKIIILHYIILHNITLYYSK